MKQEPIHFFPLAFLNKALSWSSAIMLVVYCSQKNEVSANPTETPGLAIARLALPSIPTNGEIVNITGTPIGEKVVELKHMLQGIEDRTSSIILSTRDIYEETIVEVNLYYRSISEIEAKLQLGTTPANPHLTKLRDQAFYQLDQIAHIIGEMNNLTSAFSTDAEQVKILFSHIESTLNLPGVVDEDHAHLILMSDELTRVGDAIHRTINVIDANTKRQNEWLDAERIRFANLSSAINRGKALPRGIASELSYPKPILPEISHASQKVSAGHKEPLEKPARKNERVTISPPASLIPLPLTPLQDTPKDAELNKTPHSTNTVEPVKPPSPAPHAEESMHPMDEPLPISIVTPHPKIPLSSEEETISHEIQAEPFETAFESEMPVSSAENTQTPTEHSPETIAPTSTRKDKALLGSLEPNQEPKSQKWFLFSSAKRGLKGSSNKIEIVNVIDGDASSKRGEEVKSLLLEMGLKPQQIQVVNARKEEGHSPGIYIYGDQ